MLNRAIYLTKKTWVFNFIHRYSIVDCGIWCDNMNMEKEQIKIYKNFYEIIDSLDSESDKNAFLYLLAVNGTLSREQRVELVKRLLSKKIKIF